MAMERQQVKPEDQWNVNAMYASLEAWTSDYKALCPKQAKPRWPSLEKYKGQLHSGASVLKNCLEEVFDISRKLTHLYTYAHLRHDEDIANDAHKQAYSQSTALLHDFSEETAWLEPEILALPPETVSAYLKDPLLADYHFHLEKLLRIKQHMLSKECEELLALSGKALQTAYKAFNAINDADFKFEPAEDDKGQRRELSHGLYGLYIRDPDRHLRQTAFSQMHHKYLSFENSLCELLNGQIQSHLFNAKARNYKSCLEAALFPKNIDPQVYHALIKAVHNKMSALHKYIKLRKKLLKVEELHLYDMYVPLIPNRDFPIAFDKAVDLVIESVAPLGTEYQNILHKGLKDNRWVDRYENQNKRSGAYSSGCYDSMPYILMNYKNIMRDVFTLAHEAGHSMHSYLSHTHQMYHQADYPIFLAEVASTFNEELLMQLMLKHSSSKEEKMYLINQKIEDIRTTLFRQTMFAEFELKLHEMAEQQQPLTPKILKEIYLKLNQHYFGTSACVDTDIQIEWARIPHFYYNFYVFQYATGISAALSLSERVLQGGAAEREAYLAFLKGGSSRYPIDLLKVAGVDMLSPEPVETAIVKFSDLVDQLSKLAEES